MSNQTITPIHMDGELRILDTDLAERLGFSQPRDIRKIIARHGGALSQMGALAEMHEVVGKGQRVKVYYLNRKQAIFITAKSETPEATDITIEIIHRFDEYEQRKLASPTPDPVFHSKPHDEWTEEELRTKMAEIHLYRRTMSTAAALWMMRREGFPMPPDQLLPAWQRQNSGLFGVTVNILSGGGQ